ncbi:TPR-like protein [Macrolepiota fuliginosa MF-IS2]|uniref:TPR-like protein n=1 Tax=Macrolepiota fuliginosa MF-IS2 TaxID=1400762 RepID=A0A9P5XFH0_9AGAR|nr:TPR-like protein [Macrolepiota fuliginosa MF-IS2]
MSSVFQVDAQTATNLRRAAKECSERGLVVAAKWASELLLALPFAKRRSTSISQQVLNFSTSTPAREKSLGPTAFPDVPSPLSVQATTQNSELPAVTPSHHPDAPKLYEHPADARVLENELEDKDIDLLDAARAFIESREFSRAIHVLKDGRSAKARFVRVYSTFMASEKKAMRDWHKLDNNRLQPPVPVNNSLGGLLDEVQDAGDPWLLFLKALFLSRLSRREEAIECALLSISGFPWNWSCWTLLGSCISDGEELSSLLQLVPLLPTHPLVHMFQVKTLSELHQPTENELALCDRLLSQEFFPGSVWLMSLRACVLYHLHEFGQAEQQFEKILVIDPYRIDDIDIYSNILYVTDNRLKLSRLAHEFLALEKDRPEICCLVGNHYSLRAEHEKAVKYFRRATQLDRTYLSAWTLMGHEYVEMKNSHAAIEAYRRAVDVNRKDYRAWYGLGQAYELLSMHHYSLYYYQRATALRPYDIRLWQAQGLCYEEIGRRREAIECYKRALIPADPHEININLKLATLYTSLDDLAEAVAYHRRVVEVCQADLRPIQEYAKSCLQVAEYHLRVAGGDLYLAKEYLERVANSNAEDVMKATELLKVVKSTLQARSQNNGTELGGQTVALPLEPDGEVLEGLGPGPR